MIRQLLALLILIPTLAFADAYSTVVLADGPCHYYRMEATSGTAETDAAAACGEGSNTGTYVNTPTLNQPGALQCAGCTTNPSVLFTRASSQTMDLGGADGSFTPSSGNGVGWTHEYWVKFTAFPAASQMVVMQSSDGATSQSWRSGYTSTGGDHWIFLTYAGSDGCIGGVAHANLTAGTPTTGVWYYLTGTTVGAGSNVLASQELWVNASSIASTSSFTSTLCSSVVSPRVGALGNGIFFLDGFVDEVAVYNIKLSSTQIATHYNTGITAGASGAGMWPSVVRRPELPRHRDDVFWPRFVAGHYHDGQFASNLFRPLFLNVGYVPFSITPDGRGRFR